MDIYEKGMNYLDTIPVLENLWVQLIVSIIMDIIGFGSYILDIMYFSGELSDIIFAPLQAIWIYWMMGKEEGGTFFVVLGFTEEILPFTDIIPSCSIAWIYKITQNKVE